MATDESARLHLLERTRSALDHVAAQNLRTMVMAMVATNATLAGLVLAAVQLAA